MNSNKAGIWIVGVSLAFAAIMLLSSFFLADSPYRDSIMIGIIAIWWIPYSYFCARLGWRCKSEFSSHRPKDSSKQTR